MNLTIEKVYEENTSVEITSVIFLVPNNLYYHYSKSTNEVDDLGENIYQILSFRLSARKRKGAWND